MSLKNPNARPGAAPNSFGPLDGGSSCAKLAALFCIEDYALNVTFSADSNTSGRIAGALHRVLEVPEVSASVSVRRRFPLRVPRTLIRELQ